VPVARKLFVLSIPTAAIVAFAVAAPAIGIDTALLSFRLLGGPLTLARLFGSVVLALVVAAIVARVASSPRASVASFGPPPDDDVAGPRPNVRQGFLGGLDHLGAWYVAGILAAAAFEAAVDPHFAARLPRPLDALASAAIAIPIAISAQGATPLAALMLHKGFSTAAALSLLLVGPATNLPILALLRREIGLRAAVIFAVASVCVALVLAMLLDRVVPLSSVPQIHPLVEHRHHPLEWAAAGVLGLLIATSVLRMGPRGWISAMAIETHEEHAREHGCSHVHG
jgi:uncharacterized membrane protein YraQ (UPF0718 family)